MNKVSWFAKQLQHKTGNETLQLSLNEEEYRLTAQQSFELDSYVARTFTACAVSAETDSGYAAVIVPGHTYRLRVDGHSVLFKIMTRKIWFYDSVQTIAAEQPNAKLLLKPTLATRYEKALRNFIRGAFGFNAEDVGCQMNKTVSPSAGIDNRCRSGLVAK